MTVRPWRTPPLAHPTGAALITHRQADILAGLCHGHSNAQIGERLHICEDTVKTHVRRLLEALPADNRAHAAALACSGQVTVIVKGDK